MSGGISLDFRNNQVSYGYCIKRDNLYRDRRGYNFLPLGRQDLCAKKEFAHKRRVLKDKAFAGLRKHAGDMGRASKLASAIYKQLPGDIRGRFIFRAIAGDAASLLYQGKSEEEVTDALTYKYLYIPVNKDKRSTKGLLRNKNGEGSVMTDISTKTANKKWKYIFLKRWKEQGKDISVFEHTWEHKEPFRPITIPRIAEYFMDLEQASGLWKGRRGWRRKKMTMSRQEEV